MPTRASSLIAAEPSGASCLIVMLSDHDVATRAIRDKDELVCTFVRGPTTMRDRVCDGERKKTPRSQ